jgi:FtsZ-binding cell division protein ZapB
MMPMRDLLIKALREGIEPDEGITVAFEVIDMAADEIERLRAENERLREQENNVVTQLAEWQVIAEGLRAENERLRADLAGRQSTVCMHGVDRRASMCPLCDWRFISAWPPRTTSA